MLNSSCQKTSFKLEEVFQLLRESLEFDPFNQSNFQPTKKHIARLRTLLGQDFSFWLAETGNLFFSALVSIKTDVDNLFDINDDDAKKAEKCYDLLLLLSQYNMCIGLRSERTITTLLNLNALVSDQSNLTDDIYTIIDNSLCSLQTQICKQITIA